MLSATRNPKILICSPEQAWLLHRELGAMATQTSRILINWLLCKGRIYCAMHKEAVLKKRGTTVPVIKRQPQNTPASRRKWTPWHYRDATSLNKDRRKLFAERGKRGLKSHRHLLHSNLPSPCPWGPSTCQKGSLFENKTLEEAPSAPRHLQTVRRGVITHTKTARVRARHSFWSPSCVIPSIWKGLLD